MLGKIEELGYGDNVAMGKVEGPGYGDNAVLGKVEGQCTGIILC